ncbi:MAG: ATP-binding protein, partial [bacterium]
MINRLEYIEQLENFKDNKIIKIITGMRRSGKSILMQMFKDKLIEEGTLKSNIQFINFELMKYDYLTDYKLLYDLIVNDLKEGKNYIFLDEIQQVEKWEKAINSLSIEYDVDIYITGSNAHLLSSEISTLIAGRYVEIKVLPLSFKEYYSFYKGNKKELFDNYMKYGSLPQLTSLPNNQKTIDSFLEGIYNTIILKDVVQRMEIKNTEMLSRVFRFICTNIGSQTSSNNIANIFSDITKENIKHTTVNKMLQMLENSYILYKVHRYDIKGKETLKTLEKYYVSDIGIKNHVTNFSLNDYGHMIENIVYLELLRKGYKVYIGKYDDSEIDFVCIKDNETVYYQVTKSLQDETVLNRETKVFYKINDMYPKIIITTDKVVVDNINGIKVINLIEWLIK